MGGSDFHAASAGLRETIPAIDHEEREAVRRLISGQPDAGMLADALGLDERPVAILTGATFTPRIKGRR